MIRQIVEEKEQINNEIERWEELLSKNAPVREKIKYARLEEYVEQAVRMMEDEILQ